MTAPDMASPTVANRPVIAGTPVSRSALDDLAEPRRATNQTVRNLRRFLIGNRLNLVGLSLVVTFLVLSLVGETIAPHDPYGKGDIINAKLVGPSREHLLGTDELGRDVFSRILAGTRVSLQVAAVVLSISVVVGVLVGAVAGYFGGIVDAVLRVLIDVFLSVPSLLFLILIASLVRGVGVVEMALIIGIFAWSWPARAVRSQALSLKERPFVQVARLNGMGGTEIVGRELLPHLMAWLGANFLNAFIAAILAESGLSILGLGPQQEMTLGTMIYWSLSYSAIFLNLWWWWMTPVVTLMALFLSLYLVHLGLDEVGNPRLRTQA